LSPRRRSSPSCPTSSSFSSSSTICTVENKKRWSWSSLGLLIRQEHAARTGPNHVRWAKIINAWVSGMLQMSIELLFFSAHENDARIANDPIAYSFSISSNMLHILSSLTWEKNNYPRIGILKDTHLTCETGPSSVIPYSCFT
jgi:hypothetical protein